MYVNFIKYNIILLLSGFPALILFSVGLMACFAPLALFAKMAKPPGIIVVSVTIIAGAFQVYFWGLWSAYCVATTYKFTLRPEATWDWLYFVTGFFNSSSLIAWLSHKERQGQSYEQQRKIVSGTMYYTSVAWITFILFSIWPTWITPGYGWVMNYLGLAQLPVFAAESSVAEFTDNEYNYAFQYPSDWKMMPPPPKQEGDLGEVRVFVQGPRAALMTIVGNIGKTVSASNYRSNPDSDRIVKALIDLSIDQYKKMSRTLNASRMTVLESKALPSNMGVRFYISTLHFTDNKPTIAILGTHLQPFDKPYMIIFFMNIVADKRMKEDQKIYDNIFNSFNLVGEKPLAR